MGAYVNPENMSKESWLKRNGIPTKAFADALDFREEKQKGNLIVCLVENPFFSAAAIAYSEAELHRFRNKNDTRPKTYYIVAEDLLHEVSPELRAYQKR